MNIFKEKELTIEEIVDELKISKRSYDKIKKLNMIDDLILMFRKDNDLNVCRSDMKYAFQNKEVIGYILLSNDNNLMIDIDKENKEPKSALLLIQDIVYDITLSNKIIDRIKTKDLDFFICFKQSSNKRINGLIMGK